MENYLNSHLLQIKLFLLEKQVKQSQTLLKKYSNRLFKSKKSKRFILKERRYQ